MCAFGSHPHTLLISRMLPWSERFSDSNQVCMWREWLMRNNTCWVRGVTEWWWWKALCSLRYWCPRAITRISSSSRQWAAKWWKCFPSYLWWLKRSMWHSIFKEKGSPLVINCRHDDWWIWLDSMIQIASIHTQPVCGTFSGWFCVRSEWFIPAWCDEWSRFVRPCISRSETQCRIWLVVECIGLPIQ